MIGARVTMWQVETDTRCERCDRVTYPQQPAFWLCTDEMVCIFCWFDSEGRPLHPDLERYR